ncbi:hypothetical protein PCA31118_00837 [Pandoraea captiosa]|uniref:Uncharacterized protein n=1 Tax=Pandoraea captiosa TaxID=2508302 RepID=A0A5E4ZNF1_9BURK|nr:hypothetical protein [Pandoraea captiosa]VVE61915.1 hypothetical protein PCA31118_00837 [Pandoraea captiosa]
MTRYQGSHFANRAAAIAALELLMPTLLNAMQNDIVGQSGCLHIVVMDPAMGPDVATFEESILYELSLPDPKQWDADYGAYARAKARVSWLTGKDSRVVQLCEPYRLRCGDTNLWGSVAQHGIVVGVSGALPHFDEALAGCVAHCLRAMAQHRANGTVETLALNGD